MELVEGVPITKFGDDNKLSPRERLELFVPVCQAIQYAHTKGVIHRDVKPSKVLVALCALGVLLYELLTGTTPFDRDRFRKAAHDEIRPIIASLATANCNQ